MKVDFKMGGENFRVDFTIVPTKGSGFSAIAKSLKDLETLQRAIPLGVGGDDLIGKIIAGKIEKQLGIPVDVDYDHRGAGFGFKLDMYSLVKKLK
jgi:hypothetical protein